MMAILSLTYILFLSFKMTPSSGVLKLIKAVKCYLLEILLVFFTFCCQFLPISWKQFCHKVPDRCTASHSNMVEGE